MSSGRMYITSQIRVNTDNNVMASSSKVSLRLQNLWFITIIDLIYASVLSLFEETELENLSLFFELKLQATVHLRQLKINAYYSVFMYRWLTVNHFTVITVTIVEVLYLGLFLLLQTIALKCL